MKKKFQTNLFKKYKNLLKINNYYNLKKTKINK